MLRAWAMGFLQVTHSFPNNHVEGNEHSGSGGLWSFIRNNSSYLYVHIASDFITIIRF